MIQQKVSYFIVRNDQKPHVGEAGISELLVCNSVLLYRVNLQTFVVHRRSRHRLREKSEHHAVGLRIV